MGGTAKGAAIGSMMDPVGGAVGGGLLGHAFGKGKDGHAASAPAPSVNNITPYDPNPTFKPNATTSAWGAPGTAANWQGGAPQYAQGKNNAVPAQQQLPTKGR